MCRVLQGVLTSGRAEYTGMVDCIRKVFAKEGIRGFYHGTVQNCFAWVERWSVPDFTQCFRRAAPRRDTYLLHRRVGECSQERAVRCDPVLRLQQS